MRKNKHRGAVSKLFANPFTSMNKLSYILAISILLVVGCGSLNVPNQPSGLPVSCHNAQYGLTFFLPSDWRGYSVLIQ